MVHQPFAARQNRSYPEFWLVTSDPRYSGTLPRHMDSHLADLCLALGRMCQYGLKINPLRCMFGVSTGKVLGFIIPEHGIQIDPKKIECIKKVQQPQSKNDIHLLQYFAAGDESTKSWDSIFAIDRYRGHHDWSCINASNRWQGACQCFFAPTRYRVVKIVHSRSEVVLRTMKHTMIYPSLGLSSEVRALRRVV
jgi:hypothetical protein